MKYDNEPWAILAKQAGFVPEDTEAQAREAFRFCAKMFDTAILKAAADRLDGYMTSYGLVSKWSVTSIGMKLVMEDGANKITKYCDFAELQNMERYEKDCMRGLSS